MKNNRRLGKHLVLLLLGLSLGAVMPETLVAAGAGGMTPRSQNPAPNITFDDSPLAKDLKLSTSFAPVVKKVAPSVVSIFTTHAVSRSRNPIFDDPIFRRFFGENPRQPRRRVEESLGSGVIVSSDGYILTASHVVEGADTVKVSVAIDGDEQEFDAQIIGSDPPTDVAVLRIEGKAPFRAITLADSEKLEVGDAVLAVGNPFAVGQTVTLGIVSAVGRGGMGIAGYENFIQTDAAINVGNSGGPLVDAAGRLVGINTAILSRSGGFMGVSFAVPSSMARNVLNQLVATGKVTRGFLGINIQPLTPDLARAFDLPEESGGVLVSGVGPDSAAEKAGVKEGDVIVELDGKKVGDPRTLQLLVSQTPPGSKINFRVLRGHPGRKPTEKTLTATLGTLPETALRSPGFNTPSKPSNRDSLDGVEVTDLDESTRRQFDIPKDIHGALVVEVQPDSNAGEAGLSSGDIILEIDRKPVENAQDAVELSEKATGDRILLRVWSQAGGRRQGGTRYVAVDNTPPK